MQLNEKVNIMTINFQEMINQCDDIDLMDDATIFSISGTKSQASAQLLEIENTLELVNCSITHIEDDSTGFEEDFVAYSVFTNLTMMKFHALVMFHEEKNQPKNKLNRCEKLATRTVAELIRNPLSYLLKQGFSLDDFQGEPIINYNIKDKSVVINCEEEGFFIVAVSDENGTETSTGFSEKLSIVTYMMYEDLLLEKNPSSYKVNLNAAA